MRLRATLKIRNAAMIEARKRKGLSQPALAAKAGVALQTIAGLEKLDFSRPKIDYDSDAIKITIALEIPIEEVLPEGVKGYALTSSVEETAEVNPAILIDGPVKRFLLASPDDVLIEAEQMDQVKKLLPWLSWKERKILKMRFEAISGTEASTRGEIAQEFKVSEQRIKQIEHRALHKIQMRLDPRTECEKGNGLKFFGKPLDESGKPGIIKG